MICRERYRVMSKEHDPKPNPEQPLIYQIRIKGHLDHRWRGWFENATINMEENGDTLLTCPVVDQAALHGLLKKVRDFGMTLISVNQALIDEISDSDFES